MGEKIYRLSDLVEIEPGSADMRLTLAENLSMRAAFSGVQAIQQALLNAVLPAQQLQKLLNDQMVYAQRVTLALGGLPRDYRRRPEIIITPSRPRHLALLDKVGSLPDYERLNCLDEVMGEMERLPQENRRAYLWKFFQILPRKHQTDSLWEALEGLTRKSEKTESGLSVVRFETTDTDDERYWREVIQQAKKSGNVRRYLEDRNIPKSTFYDWKNRLGL